MEAIKRKQFQGVTNIIRFNWHFYVLSLLAVLALLVFGQFFLANYHTFLVLITSLAVLSVLLSLAVSWYVYDSTDLYTLNWLDRLNIKPVKKMVNINAGFDETSRPLSVKYPDASLSVFDFYDANKHTEVSIARARKTYPAYPGTISIVTSSVPLPPLSVDNIFVFFSAHEIRDRGERIIFFAQLKDKLTYGGKIIVLEHLRDIPNFIAYNIGFMHFHSKTEWKTTFESAGLNLVEETKITPFLSAFIFQNNATAA
jgi:hypothetical protein